MKKEILRMERVSYQARGSLLLDSLSLNIFEGEILGLVPVNDQLGAEALTDVLCHNRPLHYGYVYYRERLINTWRHPKNVHPQIALIQNQSSLAPDLTVAENVFVMGSNFSRHLVGYRQLREEFRLLAEKLDVELDSDTYADNLTVYERVAVELMKALNDGCRLAILWDVCTFVSPYELHKLHRILRKCLSDGISFLYISPHFEEAEELCGRTLCMVNGQIIKSLGQGHPWPNAFPFFCNQEYFDLVRDQITKHQRSDDAPIAFEARELCSTNLTGLSFQVRQGECLVVQDMDDRVAAELLRILQGDSAYTGRLLVGGGPLKGKHSRRIAIVQELATKTMLFPQMSYLDNLCFTLDHRIRRIWRSEQRKWGICRDLEPVLGRDVFDKPIASLTEKEKYDLVYTRVLLQRPEVVFCVFPFKNTDGNTRMHICEMMERLLKRGIAVVILAVNLADSLALADRVLQIQDGREIRQYLPEDFTSLPNSTPWRRLYEDLAMEQPENR